MNKIEASSKVLRIGVFYDGNYFLHVSNFYNYVHPRKRRLSISGLHEFIRQQVAQEEGREFHLCQIVDAHYFRGRLSAQEAAQRGNQLYYDRVFEDILMSENVVTHYLPVKNFFGRKEEKGIDVWLALEAFELTMYKEFDVLVLIASDGDYVPLVRKVNTIGTRVMVLSWDFEYTNDEGQKMVTRTSQDLLEVVTFPVQMNEIIDNRIKRNDPMVNNLFVQQDYNSFYKKYFGSPNEVKTSEVLSLKNGYGFIKYPNNNLFFYYNDVIDCDFNDLMVGDRVEFNIERKFNGQDVAKNVRKIDANRLDTDIEIDPNIIEEEVDPNNLFE